MGKLTRAQRTQISGALAEVSAALNYLMGDDVAVCRRATLATTSFHFTRAPIPEVLQNAESKRLGHYALQKVAKDYGSPLCRLWDAQKRLGDLFHS